ncbi:MAG: AmmeMemoRadiSam system protein B [Candidatus Omnitrophica bacterium]|nr:AmmeMemoRadiSam system protein B [Candidatus Omnitrophota bacterium]
MKKLSIIISVLAIGYQLSAASCFSQEIKKADLAGKWYPADKSELRNMLEGFIEQAMPSPVDGRILGVISPHAGYDYSGRIAGYSFKAVKDKGYKAIVIIGFSHRKFFNGISVYEAGKFQTPLGEIDIDADFARALINQDKKISFYPGLFTDENSVEMIIPFIQISQPGAKIVPIAFGSQGDELCDILAKALSAVIKDREDVLIIASTDMSHFHPYDEAKSIDNFTIKKLQEFNPRALYDEVKLGSSELCGVSPVVTLMLTMKILGADSVKVLGYENSGDVTGDKRSVVGYMSVVFYKKDTKSQGHNVTSKEGETGMLNEKQKKRLLEIARSTIETYVKSGKAPEFTETDPELVKEKGAFVTLHYKGELRGCIGNIIGRGPLYKTVRAMAIESSTNDPRFPAVRPEELKDIKVEISVLSVPERVTDVNKIIMGTHGVIVKRGFNSGVFLPQVATETGWSREEFLSNLCAHKAGLSPSAWKDPSTEIYSFTAEVFGEE